MTNTQLLKDLIAAAQSAGDSIRSKRYHDAEYYIDNVVTIANILAQPQLLRGATNAEKFLNVGLVAGADDALQYLIVDANKMLKSI